MPELATYRAIDPVTIILGASPVVRGLRVSRAADGTHAVQDASERGDYVTIVDGVAGEAIAASALSNGSVPMLVASGVTVADGDDAYSAAGGYITNVSTSAQYIGKIRQPAAPLTLTVVQLKAVN